MRTAFALVALAALWTPLAGREPGGRAELRILVANDDGIDSAELEVLCEALAEIAEVTVCAPDSNRSGSSQSVTMGQTMTVRAAEVAGAVRAVAVGGTPADAVTFGLLELAGDGGFDVVVSGINRGANVGEVSHYSGTVGAAMEAAYRGVPAVAVSQGRGADTRDTAAFARRFVQELLAHDASPRVVWSINAPGAVEGPPVVAPMGGSYVRVSGFRRTGEQDGAEVWRSLVAAGTRGPHGCDTDRHLAGRITVTPLSFDWTDRHALEAASGWDLSD